MFNLDNYVIGQILAIVGIVLFIFVLVGYIITTIFSKIMFDILGLSQDLHLYHIIILIGFIKSIKGVFGRGIGELLIY